MESGYSEDIKVFASGAGIALVGKVFGRALHMGGQVVLARFLGPAAYGLYAIGWTILRIVSLIGPLGLENGIIRFTPKFDADHPHDFKSIFLQSVRLSFLSGLILSLAVYLSAPWLADHLFQKPDLTLVIRLFALSYPVVCSMRVIASSTRASQRVQYAINSEEISQPAVNLALVLLFYWLGFGLKGALIASGLSFLFALGMAIYYVWRLFPQILQDRLTVTTWNHALMRYSLPTAFAGIFSMAIWMVDRLFIGVYRSESEAGIYQAISLFPLIFTTILGAIKTIFAPMISNLYQAGETQRFAELIRLSTKWGLYLCIPPALTILFIPRQIIAVVYGNEYAVGTAVLVILIVGQLISIATGPVDFVLMMTGGQNDWMVITGIVFGISVVLYTQLIPMLGGVGAALTVTIAIGLIYSLALLRIHKRFGIWPYDYRFYKGGIATVVTTIALLLSTRLQLKSDWLTVLLTGGIALASFGMVLLVMGLDPEDQELLRIFQKAVGADRQSPTV